MRLQDYFAREQEIGVLFLPLYNVRERVADTPGVGKATVSRIIKKNFGKSSMEENKLSTSMNKKYKRVHHFTSPDDFGMARYVTIFTVTTFGVNCLLVKSY